MKNQNKTMLELRYKMELSSVKAGATCRASQFSGNLESARQAVATHRAISREVRADLQALINDLNRYDYEVVSEYCEAQRRQKDLK